MTATVLGRLARLADTRLGGEELVLRRAWPRGEDRLLLEYAAGGATVAGQWHADRCRGAAVARATPGAVWLAGAGVVLQEGGADRKLPAVARLAAEPGAVLVVHRPERRAVVRRPGASYAKVVQSHRAGDVLAADRAARHTGAVRLAELLGADLAAGVLEWAELPGRSVHDLLADPDVPVAAVAAAGAATGRAVAALHRAPAPPGLRAHRPEDELAAAARWVQPARSLARAPAGVDDALHTAARLLAGRPGPPAVVHRDLHDKQVLVEGDEAGLLDVDTLAVGEAAVDVANLLVHLELRTCLGLAPERATAFATAFLDAYDPAPVVTARVPAYAAAIRARLACVHSFRPHEAGAAARLVDDQSGPC